MNESLAQTVARHAARTPERIAYRTASEEMSWAEYASRSSWLAGLLATQGLRQRERVAVLLPDGPGVHVAYLAAEKAGCVTVGIGPRAGFKELEHLLRATGASALITRSEYQGRRMPEFVQAMRDAGLPLRHHLAVSGELAISDGISLDGETGTPPAAPDAIENGLRDGGLAADELFLLNSTSGTTGLPKVVAHDQLRWQAFHALAVDAGRLSQSDVFMSVVPAPFGFGLWTSHFTPTLLGVPTTLLHRFDAERAVELIERHRVTVLAAVSSQFVMLLESLRTRERDLTSLRVLFTGGESVPYARALEFEERTGATVLQFYGSNETGAVSRTRLADSREKRLRTAGRIVSSMNVRLFDEAGRDVTASGRGQPGCKGPTLSRGYWEDPDANATLIRDDGWMLLGDVVELDAEGYLTVVGRTDDFIIRGGKNISGPAVEQEVASHPAVALASAVAMPDPVLGERTCVYVELRPGTNLTLAELVAHLAQRQVSKENFPERLIVLDVLPRGSGGKVAKQVLREDVRRRLAEEGV